LSGRVLVVDDDRDMCELMRDGLAQRGFEVTWCTSPLEAMAHVRDAEFDAVVTDLRMGEMDGIEFCVRMTAGFPGLPVLVMTAFGSLESAVAAIRAGAYDFVSKPVEIDEMALRLGRAVEHRQLREEVKRLRLQTAGEPVLHGLIGKSPAMRRLRDVLARIAGSDATVLLLGETGTGKELAAQAIHRASRRADEPFVALNCAALPDGLLESELFGHVRGAFTDAKGGRDGLLRRAGRGTLFLDEVGDLPLTLQPKLLRALQERCVRPVGSEAELPFEARVIAATHRDLEAAVEDGRFREDLLYRLDVLRIQLPPLRGRGADVLELAQHFVTRLAAETGKAVSGLTHGAAEKLLAYSWPGNVRELQNCIERAVAMACHDQLTVEDLPERVQAYEPRHVLVAGDDPTELVPMEEVERRYIARVLEAVGGNKTLAARILGFDRKTLYRKLARSEPR
jgi:two-component system response regulator HydG